MNIAWDLFTPTSSFAGGLLIGLAAAAMLLLLGKVMGISGIIGSLLQRKSFAKNELWQWRVAFLIGLISDPLLWQLFAPLPEIQMPTNLGLIITAGLLVGFGTRMASGCTSGHGVCGLSRLSIRSLAATLSFMVSGVATVFIFRHVIGA